MAQVDWSSIAQQANGATAPQTQPAAPAAAPAPTPSPTPSPAASGTPDWHALAQQANGGAAEPKQAQAQETQQPADDTGIAAGLKRNTVGAVTGIYHALTDPATDEEKAALMKKVQQANKYSPVKFSDDWANNPSPATLAYHRIIDAPMEELAAKSQKETDVAKDLLEHHEYWKGGNAYLNGLTDKVLSKVPLVGPFVNAAAERVERGDPGALVDIGTPIAAGILADKIPEWRAARAAKAKSATAVEDFSGAHADIKKAIPPTRTTPYEDTDAVRARDYLEQHHENIQPIRTVQDYRDAADHEIKGIDAKVKGLVGIIPNEPIATDVLADVRQGLEQLSPKADFVENGMKALKNYDLNNPTMSQADRIREDLNAENEGALSKNKYRRSVARKTDPAFAAQELAGNSLREGIYGQLENQGVKGARELRQDQGSLIKMRNAAEAQSFNGDKVVKGTGGASLAKKVGQTAFKAGGAVAGGTLGGALGGPAGEGVGALMGGQLGGELGSKVLNIPPDLSRDALVERSFGKKVAVGSPTEPEVNLRAAPATAPTGQQPLLTDPSTLFDLGQTGEEAFATPADITTAQQTREAPYQKILDDENASAAEKAQAKTEINKLRNSPIPQSMIRKSAPAGPSNPGADFLKENASAELARRSLPYQKILDSEDHTAAEKADAHLALADLHKEADKIITQAEKAAADKAKGTSKPASKPAAKPAAKAAEPPKAAPAETAASAGSAALRDTATADLEREIRIRDLQDIATGRAKPWGGIADRRQAQEILDSAYSGPERRAQARGSAALGGK